MGTPAFGVKYGFGPLGAVVSFSSLPPKELTERTLQGLDELGALRSKTKIQARTVEDLARQILGEALGIELVLIAYGSTNVCLSRS